MKLFLCKPRGFCAGVVRAIDTVKRSLSIWGPPIYVKHEIVHNRHVVDELEKMGVVFIEDLSEVPCGARLIFSAHGVPPSIRDEAKLRNLITIDATCGLVTKVHSAAKRFADQGYQIVLIGHKNHVEIIGTAGVALAVTTIVETIEDVARLSMRMDQKIAYLTQTTLSLDDVKDIERALKKRYPHIVTMPSLSICYATQNRQKALRLIAQLADLVIVVGDPRSSNSNRLREVAQKRGIRAFLVDCASVIQQEWLEGVQTIAMTAGASTPEIIVQECVLRLRGLGVQTVEEIVYTEENVSFQLPKEVLSR